MAQGAGASRHAKEPPRPAEEVIEDPIHVILSVAKNLCDPHSTKTEQ